MPKIRIADCTDTPQFKRWQAEAVGLVEATCYEQLSIYGEWAIGGDHYRKDVHPRTRYSWVQEKSGLMFQTEDGTCFTLLAETINYRLVLFYNTTSDEVRHSAVEAWLRERFPLAYMTDAMNFRNVPIEDGDPFLPEPRVPYEPDMSMSSDGPTPPPCDPDILKKGKRVFLTSEIPPNAMEAWVKKVAAKSKQPVDWHFVGGRAVVMARGRLKKVREAILALRPEHDELYVAACREIMGDDYSPGDGPFGVILEE